MSTTTMTSLASELRIACQRVSRRVRFESSAELPPHQVSALSNLRKRSLTPGELAEIERVSAPSMTKTVNCLVDKGLVARVDHPDDGRSKMLSLTTDGRAVLDRIARARDDWMVRRLHGLTKEERAVLRDAVEILQRVVAE